MPNKKKLTASKKKLTAKERKFAKAKVEGKNNIEAYEDAGYSTKGNRQVIRNEAHNIAKRPHVQEAIDAALQMHGATPEFAVIQLMKVAEQDEELGAKRLASKDILELHGWKKDDRPTLQLSVKNAFFKEARGRKEIEGSVEGDSVEEHN